MALSAPSTPTTKTTAVARMRSLLFLSPTRNSCLQTSRPFAMSTFLVFMFGLLLTLTASSMPVVDGFVARTTVFPVARHDRPQQQQKPQQQQQNARVRSPHGLNTNTNANRIDTNGARQNQWLAAVPVPPTDDDGGDTVTTTSVVASFDDAVTNRYACTRYERYDGIYDNDASNRTPSPGNPRTIALAREALELACRAPTGFNVQPYKLLLVESPEAKAALSKFCIGRNKDRVLDSDCSVVFLADREAMRSWTDYRAMLLDESNNNPSFATTKNKAKSRWAWLKLRALVALFSSGFPLPKILGGPISFAMRFAMRVVSWITRSRLVVPTLSSPECWSQKNTVLVAATYLLGCSARGLDTTPMEGYLSWGIRRSLKIPRRYTIPLVVSTGKAFAGGATVATASAASDDAGMAHGNTKETATPRFPIDTVVYENGFPS